MKKFSVLLLLVVTSLFSVAYALESVPKTEYKTRRVALAGEIPGGVAVLFAATEPVLDFMPYRQDEDFYYLTGWNEPGAAIVLVAAAPAEAEAPGTGLGGRPAQAYREILFLPTRNMRTEKYTGAKMDAATPGASAATGFDCRTGGLARAGPTTDGWCSLVRGGPLVRSHRLRQQRRLRP